MTTNTVSRRQIPLRRYHHASHGAGSAEAPRWQGSVVRSPDPTAQATDDPAIGAIKRCREAMRAWEGSLTSHDEALSVQRLCAANNAILAWLTTPPTTMAGVIATLEHASVRDCELTFLLESAHFDGERLAAAVQFPQMIAAALRKIASSS
jgi:hypothetical protein